MVIHELRLAYNFPGARATAACKSAQPTDNEEGSELNQSGQARGDRREGGDGGGGGGHGGYGPAPGPGSGGSGGGVNKFATIRRRYSSS
jgi:hypothetical protein